MSEKIRITIRIDREDHEYLKKLFIRQGYNSGIRMVVRRFVRLSKAKEAAHLVAGTTADEA